MIINVAGYETETDDDSDGFEGALGDDDDSFEGMLGDGEIDESASSDDVIDAFDPGEIPSDGIDFDLGIGAEDSDDTNDSDDDEFSGAEGDPSTPTSEFYGVEGYNSDNQFLLTPTAIGSDDDIPCVSEWDIHSRRN